MSLNQNKTTLARPATVNPKWYLVDAEGCIVGRLATRLSLILQGKNKPEYTPHIDNGDHVVVINAEKVVTTGNKENVIMYRHHTLYPGGLKEISYKRMKQSHPERIIQHAVRRMLPKTILGKDMLSKLHVYAGNSHKHQAQNPEPLVINMKRSF